MLDKRNAEDDESSSASLLDASLLFCIIPC